MNFSQIIFNYKSYENGLNKTTKTRSDYFFITNKNCNLKYLNQQINGGKENILLIFNTFINNFNEKTSCFYFEKQTKTFYMTVRTI
jgi:hypothetical protein